MVLPAVCSSFWWPVPPPTSRLLASAPCLRRSFCSLYLVYTFPHDPLGFVTFWNDRSSSQMFLLLKCFPWSPSYLSEKGDHLLFCYTCGPWFMLVLLCLFCCVTVFLCHPPYSTLVSFIFFTLFFSGGKWLYGAVLVSFSSLPWPARGGLKVVVTGQVQHLLCWHYSPQGRCCSEGFTSTIKSWFKSHSDPVKVRPFL